MTRPSKYQPKLAEQTRKLCFLGATDAEVTDFFGISEQTLNTRNNAPLALLESLKSGKMMADAEVASRLYERALSYSPPEEKVFNNQGEIVTHQTSSTIRRKRPLPLSG